VDFGQGVVERVVGCCRGVLGVYVGWRGGFGRWVGVLVDVDYDEVGLYLV